MIKLEGWFDWKPAKMGKHKDEIMARYAKGNKSFDIDGLIESKRTYLKTKQKLENIRAEKNRVQKEIDINHRIHTANSIEELNNIAGDILEIAGVKNDKQ